MIDLEKEIQEAFEEMAHKMGMCLDQYWGDGFDNPYENDDTRLAYNIFREGAKSKQAEITELKQKLEKLESGEFVLMPKGQIHKTWQDANEPENIVFKTDDLEMLGDCYDIGDLIEIKQYDSAYFNHSQIYATWTKDKAQLFFGSKEECNDVIKIVSLNKDLSDSSITSERLESISDNQTMGCKNGE